MHGHCKILRMCFKYSWKVCDENEEGIDSIIKMMEMPITLSATCQALCQVFSSLRRPSLELMPFDFLALTCSS